MDRHSEQAPKVQRDRLGGCLSLTVRNTVCPDSFAGTVARKRLTEAARSLHPLSSTRWSLLAFHVKAHASGTRLLSKTVYATLALQNTIGCVSQQARDLHVIVASLHVHWGDSTEST
jgi:hypothetical protein